MIWRCGLRGENFSTPCRWKLKKRCWLIPTGCKERQIVFQKKTSCEGTSYEMRSIHGAQQLLWVLITVILFCGTPERKTGEVRFETRPVPTSSRGVAQSVLTIPWNRPRPLKPFPASFGAITINKMFLVAGSRPISSILWGRKIIVGTVSRINSWF